MDDVIITEDKGKRISRQLNAWRHCKKPKDAKSLEERTERYFEICSELEMLPSVETYSLALGVHRSTVWRWNSGSYCSSEWAAIIQSALTTIESYLATVGDTGGKNPVWLIWRQKSVYGMSDVPGQSERERATLQATTERHYKLPTEILKELQALPDNGTETVSNSLADIWEEKQRRYVQYIHDGQFEKIPDDFDDDNIPFS